MDFPDVWELKEKQRTVRFDTFTSNDGVAIKIASKLPVVKMVSILLPQTDTTALENVISDFDYYSCENFVLLDVLKKNFLDSFPKRGSFSCIPVNFSADFDSFSITRNKLTLRLYKDTLYGISAVELLKFKTHSGSEITTFSINLAQDKLDLSKLQHELKNVFSDSPANFMWTTDDDVCPSSVAKYFSDAGRQVIQCKNTFIEKPEYGLKFPEIYPDADVTRFAEISEYVGMVMLACEIEQNDFSSYQLPDDCIEIGRGQVIHSKGFHTHQTLTKLINEIRSLLSHNPSFPWIALSIIFFATEENISRILIVSKDKINSF